MNRVFRNKRCLFLILLPVWVTVFCPICCFAQYLDPADVTGIESLSWKKVALQMNVAWYATADARKVGETVLFAQHELGGWAKNKPYHKKLSLQDSTELVRLKKGIGPTIDNGATTMEMQFLAKLYAHHKDVRYRNAFMKGLDYLLMAQYANGGWPQFFPFRVGQTVAYAAHITYNDNAMVNVMQLLKEVSIGRAWVQPLDVPDDMKEKCRKAFDKGVGCILRSQIRKAGLPTVWCAQHDEVTLAPADARSYELASFSGSESVGILLLLMDITDPSDEVVHAIESGVQWFKTHSIKGMLVENFVNSEGVKDRRVVRDTTAPALWARFYDLETGTPFFSDRDGVKVSDFNAIGHNRRVGYEWFTSDPTKMFDRYKRWTAEITAKK